MLRYRTDTGHDSQAGNRVLQRHTGITLIELVTVILILGILALIAVPRFFSATDFTSRGYFDSTLAAVRYAQKLAIATDCDVRVTINASGYALEQWINPGTSCAAGAGGIVPVNRPGSSEPFIDSPPAGVSLGGAGFPAQFYFDRIGRPRSATPGPGFGNLLGSAADIAVDSRTLAVEPETGYTRCTAGC